MMNTNIVNFLGGLRTINPLILQGTWQLGQDKGSYKIRINEDILQAQAKIKYLGNKIICPVVWTFPILSKKTVWKLLNASQQNLKFKIDKKNDSFEISFYSSTLEADAQQLIKKLNAEIFTRDPNRLNYFKDWCCEAPDQEERQKFLHDIIKTANFPYASSNAITILKTAAVSFSGYQFENAEIPEADLSGAILEYVNFSGPKANLSGVNLTNCYLNYADFSQACLFRIELGQFPRLIHDLNLNKAFILPDERHILSLTFSIINLWDLAKGSLIKKINIHDIDPNYYSIDGFFLSMDGKFLFTKVKKKF